VRYDLTVSVLVFSTVSAIQWESTSKLAGNGL
jgi:hypothetical protein